MDNACLEQLMRDNRACTFWVKPYGLPSSRATGNETYDAERLRVDFAVRPSGVELGDVLFVYRTGNCKLLYIGECVSELQEATAGEIAQNPNRGRWPWYVEVRNLTRDYGCVWDNHDLNPFRLVEEYNALNQPEPVSLNGLMFGKDKLRVPRPFADFLIARIAALMPTTPPA
jgi:hypothetical protein